MEFAKHLQAVPVCSWKTRQAIIFDWYDGPREGVCALVRPDVEFLFTLLEERRNDDDLDDRLFRLQEIPAGSVAGMGAALTDLGVPAGPVWVPLWRFPDDAARERAERHIRAMRAMARPTSMVISTQDMQQFQGCWDTQPLGTEVADWFTALGVS
jgi:hypothetical protein